MATDSKINRESIHMGLIERLRTQKAGGAFDARLAGTNTMKLGVVAPHGFTIQSLDWTKEIGFKTFIKPRETNFNKNAEDYSDNTSNGPVLTTGVNKISTNWNGQASLQDALYTKDPGFRLQTPLGASQFKDVGDQRSLELSRFVKGFNSNKYTNGSFRR